MFSGGKAIFDGGSSVRNNSRRVDVEKFERDLANIAADKNLLTYGDCMAVTSANDLEASSKECELISSNFSRVDRHYDNSPFSHVFSVAGSNQNFKYTFDRIKLFENADLSLHHKFDLMLHNMQATAVNTHGAANDFGIADDFIDDIEDEDELIGTILRNNYYAFSGRNDIYYSDFMESLTQEDFERLANLTCSSDSSMRYSALFLFHQYIERGYVRPSPYMLTQMLSRLSNDPNDGVKNLAADVAKFHDYTIDPSMASVCSPEQIKAADTIFPAEGSDDADASGTNGGASGPSWLSRVWSNTLAPVVDDIMFVDNQETLEFLKDGIQSGIGTATTLLFILGALRYFRKLHTADTQELGRIGRAVEKLSFNGAVDTVRVPVDQALVNEGQNAAAERVAQPVAGDVNQISISFQDLQAATMKLPEGIRLFMRHEDSTSVEKTLQAYKEIWGVELKREGHWLFWEFAKTGGRISVHF